MENRSQPSVKQEGETNDVPPSSPSSSLDKTSLNHSSSDCLRSHDHPHTSSSLCTSSFACPSSSPFPPFFSSSSQVPKSPPDLPASFSNLSSKATCSNRSFSSSSTESSTSPTPLPALPSSSALSSSSSCQSMDSNLPHRETPTSISSTCALIGSCSSSSHGEPTASIPSMSSSDLRLIASCVVPQSSSCPCKKGSLPSSFSSTSSSSSRCPSASSSSSHPRMFSQDSQGQFVFVEEQEEVEEGGVQQRKGETEISGSPLLSPPHSRSGSLHGNEYTCFTIRNRRIPKVSSSSSSCASSTSVPPSSQRTSFDNVGTESSSPGSSKLREKKDSFAGVSSPCSVGGLPSSTIFSHSNSSSCVEKVDSAFAAVARRSGKPGDISHSEGDVRETGDEDEDGIVVDEGEEEEGSLTRFYVRNVKRRPSHEVFLHHGGDKAALHALLRVQQNLQHKREVAEAKRESSSYPSSEKDLHDTPIPSSSSSLPTSVTFHGDHRALATSSHSPPSSLAHSLASSSSTGAPDGAVLSHHKNEGQSGVSSLPPLPSPCSQEERRLEEQLAALTDPNLKVPRVRSLACLAKSSFVSPSDRHAHHLDIPLTTLVDQLRLSRLDTPESEQQILLHQLEVVRSLALCAVRAWRHVYRAEDISVKPLSGGLSNKLYVVEVKKETAEKESHEKKVETGSGGRIRTECGGIKKDEEMPLKEDEKSTSKRDGDGKKEERRVDGGESEDHEDGIPKKVLFRVYGHPAGTELFDPRAEQKLFKILGDIGIAPRCIAEFDGGRVEAWIDGHPLQTEDLQNQEILDKIASVLAHFHATRVRSFKLPATEALQCSWRRLLPSSHSSSSSSSSLTSHTPLPVTSASSHPSSLGLSTPFSRSPCGRHGNHTKVEPSSSSPRLPGGLLDSSHGSTVSGETRSSHENDIQENKGASSSSNCSLSSSVSCCRSSGNDRYDSLGSTSSSSSSSHPPAPAPPSHPMCSCVLCRARQWGGLAMKSQADAELLTLEAEAVAEAAVEEVVEAEREVQKALRKGEGRPMSKTGEMKDKELQKSERERWQESVIHGRSDEDDLLRSERNKIRSKQGRKKLDKKGETDEHQRQPQEKIIDGVDDKRTLERNSTGKEMLQEREERENAARIEETPEDRAMEAAEFLAETATVAVDEAKELVGELGHLELHHYQQERKILQEAILTLVKKELAQVDEVYGGVDYWRLLSAASLVLSHNDLQENNLMLTTGGRLHLIDFEYAGENFRGYDIANLMCEVTIDYTTLKAYPFFTIDTSKYPERGTRLRFIEVYLREVLSLHREKLAARKYAADPQLREEGKMSGGVTDKQDIDRGISSSLSSSSSRSSSSENCSHTRARLSLPGNAMHARDVDSSTASQHVERTSTSTPPTSSTSFICHQENSQDICMQTPSARTPVPFHQKNPKSQHVAVSGETGMMMRTSSERREEKEAREISLVILENFEKMAELLTLSSHLQWAFWSAVRTPMEQSTDSFSYLQYAKERLRLYDEKKKELICRGGFF
ncbi:phosphotransferase enzyme family protein [Cystoisospora suis]|uniref:Phosphotransferase enzyme family protein n=1 Tax=Cystoisospora suis TaxID=483139 RepID=A0A2C6KXJ1_9APIC|nr:phosphotransferase enzyme family protein [Cystoisospora suis]